MSLLNDRVLICSTNYAPCLRIRTLIEMGQVIRDPYVSMRIGGKHLFSTLKFWRRNIFSFFLQPSDFFPCFPARIIDSQIGHIAVI